MIKVKTDLEIISLNFDFNIKDYDKDYSCGSVVGFSNNMYDCRIKSKRRRIKRKEDHPYLINSQ
jgi:hypothetical protein